MAINSRGMVRYNPKLYFTEFLLLQISYQLTKGSLDIQDCSHTGKLVYRIKTRGIVPLSIKVYDKIKGTQITAQSYDYLYG